MSALIAFFVIAAIAYVWQLVDDVRSNRRTKAKLARILADAAVAQQHADLVDLRKVERVRQSRHYDQWPPAGGAMAA